MFNTDAKKRLNSLYEGVTLVSAVSNPISTLGQLAVSSLGIGLQYGIILPFSRMHESKADTMELDFMAKVGFDPRQSIKFWQKMTQSNKGQQPAEFLSTHPAHATRIQKLSAHMPTAMKFYKQAWLANKSPSCSQ